jgi:hypothetical protein
MSSWPIWAKPGDPSGGGFGRVDWSTEPGVQEKPPEAPKAVRVAYLLEEIADEFRALKAAAVDDGKHDVLVATTCTLELAISWTIEGKADVKFWVLDVGAGASRKESQKVTVEMSLLGGVPVIARGDDGESAPAAAEAIDWSSEDKTIERETVTKENGGALRLAFMLEKLADEFRRARASAAGKAAVLRYEKVTLELTGVTSVDANVGAKFWIVDLGGGASGDRTETITVEMKPADLNTIVGSGIYFLK